MKIKADATIDLDEKRKVWVEVSAEGDGEPSEEFLAKLAKGAAAGALDAFREATRGKAPDAVEKRMKAGADPDRPKPIGVD